MLNIHKDLCTICEASVTCFHRHHGHIGHDANTGLWSIHFLHQGLMDHNVTKLHKVFLCARIHLKAAELAHNVWQHVIHEVIKTLNSICGRTIEPVMTQQQVTLELLKVHLPLTTSTKFDTNNQTQI